MNRYSGCRTFAPRIFGKLSKNIISIKHKITASFVRERTRAQLHYEVKCRNALWSQARGALWSNYLITNERSQANWDFSCARNMNCCFARCAATMITRDCHDRPISDTSPGPRHSEEVRNYPIKMRNPMRSSGHYDTVGLCALWFRACKHP